MHPIFAKTYTVSKRLLRKLKHIEFPQSVDIRRGPYETPTPPFDIYEGFSFVEGDLVSKCRF